MDSPHVADLVRLVIEASLAILGFFAVRTIKGVEHSVAEVKEHTTKLTEQDTLIRIKLAELEVRIVNLELQQKGVRS